MSHRLPQILPDGKTLIFTVWTGPGSDERHVHAQNLESGERHVLISGGDTGRYISTGHLAYVRNDTLMAVPMELAALRVTGAAPTPLAETPRSGGEGSQWAFSDSGIVAYVPGDPIRYNRRLVWVDRRGNVEPVPAPPQLYENVVLSPDARSAAVEIHSGTIVIWLYDFARGTLNPLTRTGSSQSPAWTSDGKHVVYRGTRTGFRNLFWKTVDGTTDEERLVVSETVQTPASSSPDGKWLAYTDVVTETGLDVWLLPLSGDRKPQLLLGTPTAEGNPHFSPDGRWIALQSDESGRSEVFVMPVTGPKTKTQISTIGGDEPLWARNGRELFYLSGNKMMAVDISTQPALTAGTPRILFEGTYVPSPTGTTSYSISEDGQRFLRVQAVQSEPPSAQINIVLNWLQELKQKAR